MIEPNLAQPSPSPSGHGPTRQAPFVPGLVRNGTPEQYQEAEDSRRNAERTKEQRAVEQAEPVVLAVERVMAQRVSISRVKAESGIADSDLQNLLMRRRPHREAVVSYGWSSADQSMAVAKLSVWLEERQSFGGDSEGYAETPTLKSIADLCLQAHEKKRLLVIIGSPGVGKSRAANAAVSLKPRHHNAPGLVRIEVSEADRTINRLMLSIYSSLLNRERPAMGDEAMAEVCKALRPGDVVILDECQRLALCQHGRGVEAIREIYDCSPASIVMLGNEYLLRNGNLLDPKLYGAFASRARVFKQFMYTSADDVAEYLCWRGLRGSPELLRVLTDRLTKVGKSGRPSDPFGLRSLAQIVDDAVTYNEGASLTPALLLEYLKNAPR